METTMQIKINVPDTYVAIATVNDVHYQADPAAMSNEALLHIFEYGFQRLVNDKTGGSAKTADDKAAIATAAIDRLTADTYERRAARGESADPLTKHIRSICRAMLSLPAFAADKKLYNALPKEAAPRGDWLTDWYDARPDKLREAIEAQAKHDLAEEAKRAATVAKLAVVS